MKRIFGLLSIILGSILSALGLLFMAYYGLNWDLFTALTGIYQIPVYLIYVSVLVGGCVLVWFGRRLRRGTGQRLIASEKDS